MDDRPGQPLTQTLNLALTLAPTLSLTLALALALALSPYPSPHLVIVWMADQVIGVDGGRSTVLR